MGGKYPQKLCLHSGLFLTFSGNLAATNTPNGHTKKSSHQGDSSIGSPARRREVSPIQNHVSYHPFW